MCQHLFPGQHTIHQRPHKIEYAVQQAKSAIGSLSHISGAP
jgi:hypothetical protein